MAEEKDRKAIAKVMMDLFEGLDVNMWVKDEDGNLVEVEEELPF